MEMSGLWKGHEKLLMPPREMSFEFGLLYYQSGKSRYDLIYFLPNYYFFLCAVSCLALNNLSLVNFFYPITDTVDTLIWISWFRIMEDKRYSTGSGSSCAVRTCRNTSKKRFLWESEPCEKHVGKLRMFCSCPTPFKFHHFPKETTEESRLEREKWLYYIQREDWKPYKCACVINQTIQCLFIHLTHQLISTSWY